MKEYLLFRNVWNLIRTPKGLFHFLLGLFWVSFYVFVRFFRDFTGYKIIELRDNVSVVVIFLFIFLVLINFMTMFILFVSWYKNKYNIPTKFWVFWLVKKGSFVMNQLFWFPFDSLYKIVEQEIPFSGKFFLFLERFFTKSAQRGEPQEKTYFTYFFIAIFDVLPKIATASLFFIDVVFFAQIKYFLYALPFLFLPVLFKLLLNLMKSFGDNNISAVLNTYFSDCVFLGNIKSIYGGAFIIAEYYDVTIKPGYSYLPESILREEYDLVLKLQNILMQVYFVKRELDKFSTPVIIITSILYFVAGIIRLYYILYV